MLDLFKTAYDFIILVLNDPIVLIQTVGYLGLILIVFAETGLLFGFFLPGDSLLIAAGLFAARGDMQVSVLLVTLTISAIVGDAVGFYIGKKLGVMLYKKEDSFFFRKKHIESAHDFYVKHGGKTIIFARFVPIIRTFAPTVAGAAQMPYARFVVFNIVGAFLWVWSMVLGGYYLGRLFGNKINEYIHIVVISVIFLSLLPIVINWIKTKKASTQKSV